MEPLPRPSPPFPRPHFWAPFSLLEGVGKTLTRSSAGRVGGLLINSITILINSITILIFIITILIFIITLVGIIFLTRLNAAMCLLKMEKWREAAGVCSVVRALRPTNTGCTRR